MSVTEDMCEMHDDFAGLLERLMVLVANRSAWADGIAGGREALAVMSDATAKLTSVIETVNQQELDLTTARKECESWAKIHADLSLVEADLRTERDSYRAELSPLKAELARLKKKQIEWMAAEKKLRTEVDQYRQAFEQQETLVANARGLAKRMISETAQ
jgi:chromosome segregation ATPase